MGASINVSWKDGYTEREVAEVVKRFSGKGQSQIDDYVPYVDDVWEGEKVRWGADYISTSRAISDYHKEDLEDYFLDHINPLLREVVPDYKEHEKDYQNTYLRNYINSVNLHDDDDIYSKKVILEVDRIYTEAYPCPRIAEEYSLPEITQVNVTSVTKFYFDPSDRTPSYTHLDRSWIYKGKEHESWAFDEHKNEPIPDPELIIEGIILKGKIADYVKSNNLSAESLDTICHRFYSLPETEYRITEFGDRFQLVEQGNSIQFIFDSKPTDYVVDILIKHYFDLFLVKVHQVCQQLVLKIFALFLIHLQKLEHNTR